MDVGEIAVAVAAVAAVVTATAGAVSLGANAASHATDAISSAIIAVRRLAVSISSLMDALRSVPLPYNSTVDHALSRVQTGQGGQTSDDGGAGIYRSCGISEQAVVKHGKVVKGESPARQTSESADSAAEKLDLVAVWPTDEQINKALVRVQYQEDCLHFAVSGQSCSGKSSLINALRGMKNRDPNAAKVGHTENTASVARYSGGEWFPRVAWYDVPGAGTRKIPASQYFNQQGLFLFDFIILVYDGSFTEIDGNILKQCRGFDVPAFIVRSKSDQHIQNVKLDEEYDDYQARELYIKETRANLESNLRDLELWDDTTDGTTSNIPKLGGYIVSSNSLRKLVASFRSHSDLELAAEQIEGCIDEAELLHDLLATAYRRRYSSEQAPGKH